MNWLNCRTVMFFALCDDTRIPTLFPMFTFARQTRHVFGDLVNENEEIRRSHLERLGDEFFAKFDLSPERLPDCGQILPCGRDTFPETRVRVEPPAASPAIMPSCRTSHSAW